MKPSEHLWFVEGVAYDFTPFVDHHPGGRRLLMGARGLYDATPLVRSYHAFKDLARVYSLLEACRYRGAIAPFKHALLPIRPYTFEETGLYQTLVRTVRAEYEVQTDVRSIMYGRLYLELVVLLVCFWYEYMYLCGLLCSLIGFSFWHDYEHGALGPPSNSLWERVLTLCSLGFDEDIWNLQHNIKHHAYTGVYGHDPDEGTWLRVPGLVLCTLSSLTQRLWYFRLPLYGKMWFLHDPGGLCLGRMLLYLVLPECLVWWKTASWLAVVWYIVGKSQLNMLIVYGDHYMPATTYATSRLYTETTRAIDWGEAQVCVSANFGRGSRVVDWILGTNYQIEHHLFPALANVHLPHIAPIVRRICVARGLHYDDRYSLPDIMRALVLHGVRWLA